MSDKLHIANPYDYDSAGTLFAITLALFSPTIYVWAYRDDMLSALEEAIDYADDQGWAGVFEMVSEADYAAAADELGMAWPCDDDDPHVAEAHRYAVAELAEADLYVVGHTTLSCVDYSEGTPCIGYDWTGYEVTDPEILARVMRGSKLESDKHEIWICTDCALYREIGDLPEDPADCEAVHNGMADLGPHVYADNEGQSEDGWVEFSPRYCDCCGGLPGERYRYAWWTEDDWNDAMAIGKVKSNEAD